MPARRLVMTKEQRFKYQMFVRVRDFGVVHAALFPEASKGGQAFARVSKAVAEVIKPVRSLPPPEPLKN